MIKKRKTDQNVTNKQKIQINTLPDVTLDAATPVNFHKTIKSVEMFKIQQKKQDKIKCKLLPLIFQLSCEKENFAGSIADLELVAIEC